MVDGGPDDPFAPQDGTIMRPRPGAGRRTGQVPVPGGGTGASALQGSLHREPYIASSSSNASISDFIIGSRNPILQAAAPLLTLASRLAGTVQQANIATLRQQAVQEIQAFEDRLRSANVSAEDSLVARYVICTFVDSAVLNTPWGAQGDWASQSLLVMFHKEVSGGEKFFEILERLRADPARYIDLIELLFVCLALGYEGKYRRDPGGQNRLAELQHDLYRLIREQRHVRDEELSPHWQGVQDRRNPIIQYIPWWTVAAAAAAALVIGFIVAQAKLSRQAEPIKAALAGAVTAVDYPSAAPAAAQHVNRLKELLATEESARRLTVEEFGPKTVVTLTAPNLFRSGSARVNPDLYLTLRAIALALNQVPGHVVIVGHTDDQPVHSFQFADNFDLSRARAVAVGELMKPALANFGRVERQGAGSTQPRYRPIDSAENRARNRRVEIIEVTAPEAVR
jgi:type VI secretion system protein ImpK